MKLLNKIRQNKYLRRILVVTGCAILLFALVNLILGYIYFGKTYPGTTIQNRKVGSASEDSLKSSLASMTLLPESLTFSYKDTKAEVKTSELGITLDDQATAKQAVDQKSWLPIINLIDPPKVELELAVNQEDFTAKTQELAKTFSKEPTNAKIQLENGGFLVIKEVDGYKLDENGLEKAVNEALSRNSAAITVPVTVIKSEVAEADLSSSAQDLTARQNVEVTYKFKDKTRKLSREEIAGLHEPSDNTLVVTDGKIREQLVKIGREFGISIKNINEAIRDTKSAIQNIAALTFTLEEAPKKSYTYCVNARGVDASELSGFQNKINSVLNEGRGWSLDGQVQFKKGDSGCQFTMWLSAASQMPTFGAICDTQWSCAVSPNVIINNDRWKGASSAWNQSGGSLEDYRAMVINHEVGHWLGYGHRNCGGAGQLAPVMQQQSIDLQGCKFNAWPLPSERDSLKKNLGL